ncbi:MAG: DUF1552 domain-containing protein [Deltaproteobacteria bacterium]|nr:DUF1552 domain-containing protein [Deltaproteobacteria bacterium]
MMKRRQLLKALGMGGLASLITLGASRRSRAADPAPPPRRVIYFVTAHGHTPSSWMMQVPGGSALAFAERPLTPVPREEFSAVLQPLHSFRDRLLVVEGLANTVNLSNIEEAWREHTDPNNHSIAVAGLLTANRVRQQAGVPCTGGARSIDQELALRTAAPGRFGSRVYGSDYVPNLTVAPFSFLGPGQSSPMVSAPDVAYQDLLGGYVPPSSGQPVGRAQLIASLRPSVLDLVAREYEFLGARLESDARARLEAHRALIRDLELSLGAGPSALCDTGFAATGHKITQFMRLIRLAFACDLTRVVTFVAPIPQCPEFGYPAEAQVHPYAHQAMPGGSSCGAPYVPMAEQAIRDLGVWYANHFMYLLEQLDAVVEGNGTMLDNTVVVWLTELATPHHFHNDTFTVIAGGGNLGLRTGRYVRYPRTFTSPQPNHVLLGPASNRLHVSVLRVMGQPDTSFGLTSVPDSAGGLIPLTGSLTELFS